MIFNSGIPTLNAPGVVIDGDQSLVEHAPKTDSGTFLGLCLLYILIENQLLRDKAKM